MKRFHWKALSSLDALRGYFKDWEELGVIDDISQEGDPFPRKLFSVLYKSPALDRMALSDIDTREPEDDSMYVAMQDLARTAIAGDNPMDHGLV